MTSALLCAPSTAEGAGMLIAAGFKRRDAFEGYVLGDRLVDIRPMPRARYDEIWILPGATTDDVVVALSRRRDLRKAPRILSDRKPPT